MAQVAHPTLARRRLLDTQRLLDVLVAVAALVVSAPVWVVAAVGIRLTSRGPILFRQWRIGRDGEPFQLLKFRTMVVGSDDAAHRAMVRRELAGDADAGTSDGVFKLERDPRIIRAGRWLRATSLDELPQLVNVLRGEMSLVGPRPLEPWECELLDDRQRHRHDVRPGITGLWQVSGRNHLTTRQMLELDLRYVRERSLRADLAILAATPRAVLDGAR
jgi:lipopolysaccharide/colanic/teichoic acid biosynthesis glycosyltransferase